MTDQHGSPLERRLRAALHEGLDGDPVPTAALVAGARTGAARIRRRRRAVAAGVTALVVVAVPAGLNVLDRGAGPGPTHVASPPPSTETSPAPSPSGLPTELVSLAAPDAFPDDARLQPGDFDRPLELLLDLGDYADVPVVSGQECAAGPGGRPSAGRVWSWAEERSNALDQLQVHLTLTGWAGGGGSAALADVVGDAGRCRWSDPVSEVDVAELPGDGRWAGQSRDTRPPRGYAVVQLGDVLVAVTVHHPDGAAAAVAEAKRLVVLAAARTQVALN